MAEMQPRPVAFRGGGFTLRPRWIAAAIAFVVVLVFWETAARAGWVSALALPPLSAVGAALSELIRSDAFWRNIHDSLFRIATGWSLGTVCGLGVGAAMGIWSVARAVGMPAVAALFPIPKIALLPLLILWLGIGEASKVATIALGVFFPTVIATYSGIDNVPRNLIRMAQSFNLPWFAIVWKIILPGALPGILAGFRISASIALILLVSAEMIGAQYGIGQFILTAGNLMQTDQLLAGVVILSLLGLLIGTLLTRLERWVLRWR
jgi:taurine transport system permease protein